MTARRLTLYFVISWTALLLCFAPPVWIESAYHDNTRYFANIARGSRASGCAADSEYYWLNHINRPVTAQIECRVTEHVRTPADLAPLRVLVITLLAVAATFLAQVLFAAGFADVAALATSLAVFSLPGDANSALMTNIPNALTLVAALGAFLLVSRIGALLPWHWRRRDAVLAALALVLLTLAGLTYPVLACAFFWGGTVRLLADQGRPWRQDVGRLAQDIACFFIAMAGAWLVAHFVVPHSWRLPPVGGAPPQYQMGFSLAAVPMHAQFLTSYALPMVFRLWFFNGTWQNVALAAAMGVLTIVILLDGGIRRRLGADAARMFLTACLLLLSLAPLVVATLPQTSERTLLAAMGIVLISFVLIADRAARSLLAETNPLRPIIVPAVALALGCVGLCVSSFELAKMVWNVNMEIMFARIELAHQAVVPRVIQIIRPMQTGFGYDGLPGEHDEFNVDTDDDYINFMHVVLAGLGATPAIDACSPAGADCFASLPDGAVLLSVSDYGQPFCQLPGMVLVDFNVLEAAANVAAPSRPALSNTPFCPGVYSVDAPPPTTPGHGVNRAFSGGTGADDFWETDVSRPVAAVVNFARPATIVSYSFDNGDEAGRMPLSWTVSGSVDGKTWQTLDSRADQPAWSPFERRTFVFASPATNISYLRFVFTDCGPSHLLRIYGIHIQYNSGS